MKSGVFKLHSKLLDKEVPFRVILPENYENSSSKFPVLYLLHGLFGNFDNWAINTKILEYAAQRSFIIVCAEGGDGWYADSPHLPHHFYESYILQELIPEIEKKFKIETSRARRAIAGLSMGGYGAFKFAFRRPEMFCFAAAMSGAFFAAVISDGVLWTELQPSISAVFGDDYELRARNDLFHIIENFPEEKIPDLPFLYFDCGADDDLLPVNFHLAKVLKERGIAHDFQIFSGGHDWDYWNSRLKQVLRTAETLFTND